jgi:hypothetical protein
MDTRTLKDNLMEENEHLKTLLNTKVLQDLIKHCYFLKFIIDQKIRR